MKRNGARRLVFCVNVALAVVTAFVLANCGGGERPPAEEPNQLDAAKVIQPTGPITITGYDPVKGMVFGEEGMVNCGTQASDQTIVLKNPTTQVVNFTAKLTVGADRFKVQPPAGGVPAKGQISLQILPNPIPAKADVGPDLYAGTLEIKTDNIENPTPTVIRLHQTARGAIIRTTVVGGQVAFGDVKVNTAATQLISLTNSGNMEVTASLQTGTTQFQVDGTTIATAKVGGGATVSKNLTFGPTEVAPYTDTLALSFNNSAVHCEPPPASVTMKGNGTSSVGVSPGVLTFGEVDCGKAADFQTVKVSSTVNMTFTPTLGLGTLSKFTLASSTGTAVPLGVPVTVPSNVDYILRVVPKTVTIPALTSVNALGDKLTITTDVPLDKPHDIDLRMTAKGAILDLSPTQITQTGSVGQAVNAPFSLVNSGNAPAPGFVITIGDKGVGFPPLPPDTFTSTLLGGNAPVGATDGILIMKMPSTPGAPASFHGAVSVTAPGAILCADLPPKLLLTATGTGESVTATAGPLDFGFVNCGDTAAFKTIQITSIVDTTFTPNLVKGAGSGFTLATAAGVDIPINSTIPLVAGTPYSMRVVPKAIPTNVGEPGILSNAQGDTLQIDTPLPAPNVRKSIVLNMTAQGAIFKLSPESITCGSVGPPLVPCATPTFTLGVINSGNLSGEVSITPPASLSSNINNPTTIAAKTTRNGVLTRTGTGTGSLTLTSTSPLCADLPNMPVIIF